MRKILLPLLIAGFLFSCAERKVTSTQEQLLPEEEAKEEKVVLPEQEEALEPVATEQVKVEPREEVKEVSRVSIDQILKNDIHFDFDRYEIKEQDKRNLKAIADWLIETGGVNIRIEGHCDERGTNEYNLGLGDRRANATKSYLVMLGVPSARIATISYGEEKPLCTVQDENCWRQNRRAHFTPGN